MIEKYCRHCGNLLLNDDTPIPGRCKVCLKNREREDRYNTVTGERLEPSCPFCPDGHEHPLTHPWSVFVAPERDKDGQPTRLIVEKTGWQHISESDAEWLREVIRKNREYSKKEKDGEITTSIVAEQQEAGESA